MLSNVSIRKALECGDIGIDPLNEASIQPSSIDVHLGNKFIWGIPGDEPLDPFDEQSIRLAFSTCYTETERFLLKPGQVLLGVTKEVISIGPAASAQLDGKSGLGRLFLSIHQTAGFADAGFCGPVTLEITNGFPRPIWIYPGQPIGQLKIFQHIDAASPAYVGKYIDAAGTDEPQVSRYWKNTRPS